MNTLPLFSDSALIWSVNVLLQATLAAAVALALNACFRRSPAMRYWILCCGLLLILVSPLSVVCLQSTGLGLLSVSLQTIDDNQKLPAQIATQLASETSAAKDNESSDYRTSPSAHFALSQSPSPRPASDEPLPSPAPTGMLASLPANPWPNPDSVEEHSVAADSLLVHSPEADQVQAVQAWTLGSIARMTLPPLLLVWLSVAAVLATRLVVGWSRVVLILRNSQAIQDANLQLAFLTACRGLGISSQAVELRLSNQVAGPIAAGCLRPKVILPQSLAGRITSKQLHEILVHELAHIVRHDQIIVLLQNVAHALFWLHPFARKLNRQLAQAREEVCDNYVLGASDAPNYGRTLLTIAELAGRLSPLPGTVGLFTSRWKLEQRVAGLLDARRNRMTKLTPRGILLVAGMSMMVVALASLGTMTLAVADGTLAVADEVDAVPTVEFPDAVSDLAIGAPKSIRVSGQVLKPDGSAASGATVRAATSVWASLRDMLGEDFQPPVAETLADETGHFEIEFMTQPFGDLSGLDPRWQELWKKTTIAAFQPGFGPDWVSYEAIADARKDVSLQLVEDQTIRGRVIDLEGQPIPQVQVEIGGLRAGASRDISGWLDAAKNGEMPWTVIQHLPRTVDITLVDVPSVLTTDAQGNFEIRGVGKERVLSLLFESEAVANETVTIVTRQMQPMTRALHSDASAKEQVFGSTFEFTAAPARVVQGRVIDADTKQPLAGVTVESYKLANHFYAGGKELITQTDASGHFRLAGMAKGEGNILMIRPNDQQPYLMRRVPVPNPAGVEPVEVTAEVHRGIWITGRITDRVTGKPVPASRVYYLPYRTNEYAQALPEFDDDGNVDGDQTRYQTNQNGEYRLVGLPGPAIIGANSILASYRRGVGYDKLSGPKHESGTYALTWRNPVMVGPKWPDVMQEINPSPDQESVELDLTMDPGENFAIKIVDQAGQSVTGAKLRGLLSTNGAAVETEAKVYDVINLGPDETRVLTVHHEARNIGLVASIAPKQVGEGELTIQLLPCSRVSGTLTKDGEPLPGLAIEPRILPHGDFGPSLSSRFSTDANGRFSGTLLPGCKYYLHAEGAALDALFATVASDLEVQPGVDLDFGTLELGDDRKFISSATPSTQAASATGTMNGAVEYAELPSFVTQLKTITGVVKRPDGQPAAGATVYLGFPYSGGEARGLQVAAPKTAIVDQDGTFSATYILKELLASSQPISDGAWKQIRNEIIVAAIEPGYAPDWRSMSDISDRVDLQLVPTQALRGRLISVDGNPIAGVQLRLQSLESASDDSIGAWLDSLKAGEEIGSANRKHKLRRLLPDLLGLQHTFQTDAGGQFEIPYAGKDQVARLAVSGSDIAWQVIRVIGRDMDPISTNAVENHLESARLYGATADAIVVSPSQVIEGVVRDSTTQQPLAGVSVESAQFAGSRVTGSRSDILSCVSDEQGKFRLEGMPKGVGNVVIAVPNDDQAYFMREMKVPQQNGMQPIKLDVDLDQGVWIEGRVEDRETGAPVSSELRYMPFLDNEYAASRSSFTSIGGGYVDASFAYQGRYVTRPDGSFRIVGLPGRAVVGATTYGGLSGRSYRRGAGSEKIAGMKPDGSFATYRNPLAASTSFPHVMAEINVPEGGAVPHVLLEADAGISVRMHVTDASGKPVSGYRVSGKGSSSQWEAVEDGSEFVVSGLAADEERTLLILHEQLGIGKTVRITPDMDRRPTIEVMLEPFATVRGRIVDRNDVAIAPTRLTAFTQPLENYNPRLDNITTDRLGRFEYKNIPPGAKFRIEGWLQGESMQHLQGIEFEAVPGGTIELGVLQVGEDGKLGALTNSPRESRE